MRKRSFAPLERREPEAHARRRAREDDVATHERPTEVSTCGAHHRREVVDVALRDHHVATIGIAIRLLVCLIQRARRRLASRTTANQISNQGR